MSTATIARQTRTTSSYAVTPVRVLRSEWHKFWTVRSTWITLLSSAVLIIGLGLLVSANYDTGSREFVDPIGIGLAGTQIAQISLPVLGVLIIAGEYTSGMIRASLTAVPRRVTVLWAKAAVLAAIVFPLTLVTCLIAYPLAQTFLAGTDQEAALTDPGVLTAVLGMSAGITALSVFALGLGAVLRSVAGGIAAFVGGIMILPEVISMIPIDAVDTAIEYFPVQSAGNVAALDPIAGAPSPAASLIALVLWAAGSVAVAAFFLKRRDV
ncbi:ABC transporter permease subunit [Streptomyces sp. TRM66268-LWL]|uniref:ABC transporter permease subunit n=1 Tax=Streptomyces polyasparticus TaxID=2767826 RepID=A0ABR7SWG7_9ACTN|nr:ABC transporter permease subunit [Streptomyces polyasparticus]MBC9719124.1 ABC transporter permease subunit [Streptomyces polyasparticus]